VVATMAGLELSGASYFSGRWPTMPQMHYSSIHYVPPAYRLSVPVLCCKQSEIKLLQALCQTLYM